PLHRARLRHGEGCGAAEAGRRLGRVAALPLRSAARGEGRAAAPSRLRPAEGARRRLPRQRGALPYGRAGRPGALQEVRRGIDGPGEAAVRGLPAARGDHGPRGRARGWPQGRGEVMDLATTYLGIRLPHPLIVGAGPLGDDLDRVKQLEDAGAAMLVLRSLYEEEITGEQMDAF